MEIEKKLYYIDNSENKQKKKLKFDIEEFSQKKRGRHSNKNDCEKIVLTNGLTVFSLKKEKLKISGYFLLTYKSYQ